MRSSIAPVLALAAVTWAALLLAAPLLPTAAAAVLYAAGSLLCHQLPDRSFHLHGFQLPVCARCFGLYAGGAGGAVAAVAMAARPGGPLPRQRLYVVTALAALPTLITFSLEWGAGLPMTNVWRAVAALPLGLLVAFVTTAALRARPAGAGGLHYGECAQ